MHFESNSSRPRIPSVRKTRLQFAQNSFCGPVQAGTPAVLRLGREILVIVLRETLADPASRRPAKRVCSSRKNVFVGRRGRPQMQSPQMDPYKSIFMEYGFLRVGFAGSALCAAASRISSARKYQIQYNTTIESKQNYSNQI